MVGSGYAANFVTLPRLKSLQKRIVGGKLEDTFTELKIWIEANQSDLVMCKNP